MLRGPRRSGRIAFSLFENDLLGATIVSIRRWVAQTSLSSDADIVPCAEDRLKASSCSGVCVDRLGQTHLTWDVLEIYSGKGIS
jgi:hypothetical protein